jgi:hypothetical protein
MGEEGAPPFHPDKASLRVGGHSIIPEQLPEHDEEAPVICLKLPMNLPIGFS